MSDWSMYELEDIVWDVFSDSGDRIGPHPGAEQVANPDVQCDSHKKARHDVGNAIERNAEGSGSATKIDSQENEEATLCSSLTDGKPQSLKYSLSHNSGNVFPVPFSCQSMNRASSLGLDDPKTAGNCFDAHKANANGDELCLEGANLGNTDIANESNLRNFSCVVSQTDTVLDFLEKETKDVKKIDLLDYEWPDFGNFDDVDQMFRNGHSLFGQGSSETANELSWFSSSSYNIDGSEDTLKSGFQSSYSELTALKNSSEHEDNIISWPENDEAALGSFKSAALDYGSYASWLEMDAKVEEDFAMKGELNDFNGIKESKASTLTQTMDETSTSSYEGPNMASMQSGVSKSLPKSEGKRTCQTSEYTSDSSCAVLCHDKRPTALAVSTPQSCSPQLSGQSNDIIGLVSSRCQHSYEPHIEINHSHSSKKVPITRSVPAIRNKKDRESVLSNKALNHLNKHHQSMQKVLDPLSKTSPMTVQQKIEEIHLEQQLHTRLTIGLPAEQGASPTVLISPSAVQTEPQDLENLTGGECGLEEAGRDHLTCKVKHSSKKEMSCKSWSENILSGPTSLRQLQDVMDQLDIRTKLCIRDSLYRLARNAQQRHSVDSPAPGCRITSKSMGGDESKRCPGFMDVETDTNPIDRSIAHLLFYRASDNHSDPSNDALSFESRIVTRENLGAAPADHLVVPNQLASKEQFGGSMDR